jgi:3-deoxy-7-phosphoheptulonate synthase
MLTAAGLPVRIMIDASHSNSRKVPARQIDVIRDISNQVTKGNKGIIGLMIESHLVEGRQNVVEGQPLTYGQSITDACINFDDTEVLLRELAASAASRRTS